MLFYLQQGSLLLTSQVIALHTNLVIHIIMESHSLKPYTKEIRAFNQQQPANHDLKLVALAVSRAPPPYKYYNTYNVSFNLLLQQSRNGHLFQIKPSPFSQGRPKVMTAHNGLLSVDIDMVEKHMRLSWVMIITGYWRSLLTEEKNTVNHDCVTVIIAMMDIKYIEIDHEIQVKNYPKQLNRTCCTIIHPEWCDFEELVKVNEFQQEHPDKILNLESHPWSILTNEGNE